jgi:hypothetical protein
MVELISGCYSVEVRSYERNFPTISARVDRHVCGLRLCLRRRLRQRRMPLYRPHPLHDQHDHVFISQPMS